MLTVVENQAMVVWQSCELQPDQSVEHCHRGGLTPLVASLIDGVGGAAWVLAVAMAWWHALVVVGTQVVVASVPSLVEPCVEGAKDA
jgi:hypothetical protein